MGFGVRGSARIRVWRGWSSVGGRILELRGYREGDRSVLARLGYAAFGDGVSEWEEYFDPEKNPRMDLDGVYVVEEDGEARASATVLPLEAFVDGRAVAMGGISAVMAHPAYRRRRFAGDLMRAVLRGMRERGVHLSMLWPFAHAFYRKYGWELAGEAISYTLKPDALPTGPEQGRVRAYREGDLPRMTELLEGQASAGHPLCVRRSEKYWRSLVERREKDFATWGGREAALYEGEGGVVEGYALYKTSGWKEGSTPPRNLDVSELVWETPVARRGLLSFVGAHNPDDFEVRYQTPRGEPLHPYLQSSYVKAEVSPEFMVRLVDVEGALGLLNRDAGAPLVLEVADDGVPENAGSYTVGNGEVVRGAEAAEKVVLDVRQLAQLYAGYLPADGLARHGLVEASSPGALELLGELFPVGDPWVFPMDHF